MSGADESEPSSPTPRYYRGTIRKLFAGSGIGIVRSDSGREIPFAAAHVNVVGAASRFIELREGMSVGFDVGWTSKGLRVTTLCVDAPPPAAPR